MTPHAFVKRQRSNSAESASSSASNKRGGSSPAALHQLAAMDLNDSAASRGSSSSSTEPLISDDGTGLGVQARMTPPDGASQLKTVLSLSKSSLKQGESWFVVDKMWYSRWKAACGDRAESKEQDLQNIAITSVGPVDNSSIADRHSGKLMAQVNEDEDVVFLSSEAWFFLEAWYGSTGVPVKRDVIVTKDGPILDLYPPTLIVSKVVTGNSLNLPLSPKTILTSSGWTLTHLKKIIADAFDIDPSTQSRLWHISESYTAGHITPAQLMDAELENAEDEDIVRVSSITEDDHLAVEYKNIDGTWIVSPSLAATPDTVSQPGLQPVFGGPSFLEDLQKRQHGSVLTQSAPSASGAVSNALRVTRSQTGANSKKGLVGLNNLGNTCFMNSALQCLSNTPSLQAYFKSGLYKTELNPDNPLGMNGEVARAFGVLMERVWAGSQSIVTPRDFKQTLSKFAPAFSGWQQHDSQELIAFLLDGLHEDLNRIKKKPYDEIPDWNGGGDQEEMELANMSWDLYKKRNDSVIVDLFQGQYRSRLTCPECNKIAIKFDPFMYLSLAIPQDRKWYGDVYLVPLDPKIPQKKVTLELPANASFRKLKQAVGDLTGYDHKKLFLTEEWSHRFYKVWSDTETVNELQKADLLVLHELPYDVDQPKYRSTKQKTSEDEGKIFVSVFHARMSNNNSYAKDKLFGEPFILAMTAEEASKVESVEKLLCERLESWNGVGQKIWNSSSSSLGDDDHNSRSQPMISSQALARTVIPDDEEDPDVDMDEVTIRPANSPGVAASTSFFVQRTPNRSSVAFYVAKRPLSGYNYQPFTNEMAIDRISLEERYRNVQSDQARERQLSNSTTRIPGSFGDEEIENLYGDEDQQSDVVNGLATAAAPEGDVATPHPVPILRTGETILVEWESGFAAAAFASDVDKKRSDNAEAFSSQERTIDPVVLEKRKLGNNKAEKRAISIDDLLDEFVKEEKLTEDNTWYCPSCKKHQEAQKKFDLWKMPDVLVIHLKRFSNERAFRDKIDTLVDFPIDGLDLNNRVEGKKLSRRLLETRTSNDHTNGDESLIYDLFAVDNHFGGLGGGHYTAFAKNVLDSKWYNFDDTRVSPVSNTDDVRSSAAYLLFYRRRTDRPIGGKTHDILASQTASPPLSAVDGPATAALTLDDHSFRNSLADSQGSSITSPYFAHRPQYGHRYGNEPSQSSDTEADLGDPEDHSSGPGSRSYPSPLLSDDDNVPSGLDLSGMPHGTWRFP